MKCMEIYQQLLKPYHRKNNACQENPFVFNLQLFAGEKTEEPTAKRLEDAKKKGQFAKSQEINAAFVLFAGFFGFKLLGETAFAEVTSYTTYIFSHLNQAIDVESIMQLFIGIVIVLLKTVFPIMIFIMIVGLLINIYQVGFNFTTEQMQLKFENLNPLNGFKRIFSKRSLVELAKSVIKIFIIGFFIYRYLKEEIWQMPKFIYLDLLTSLSKSAEVIFTLVFQICTVIFIMAILDFLYQKWEHKENLKMSKDDVKEEYKQIEGNPQIKGRIRQKQRQMAMQRMMQEVPNADVVITNPTHFAIALRYEKGMSSPMVIAKGKDYVAKKIKEIAKENKVVIVENKPLARALYKMVNIGESIPEELYKAVAEVLAYVYRLKGRKPAS